jgi:hypothetical protein
VGADAAQVAAAIGRVIARLVISPDGSGHDGYMRDVGRVGNGGIDALLDKLGAHMSVKTAPGSSAIAEDANGAVVGFASAKSRLKPSDSTSRNRFASSRILSNSVV